MIDIVVAMKTDLEMLKTAFGNALKVGPVEVIDAKKGYRLKLGDGPNGPFLSPWYPHPESGGQSLSWMPLSKGQIVGVIQPNGDHPQGVMFRAGFNGEHQPPSEDLAQNMLKALGVTLSIKDGTLTLEGNLVVRGNADFSDGHVKHEGKHIDNTHVHRDVMPGGGLSGVPAF